MEEDEEYEIPEGFVDQGIEKGSQNLWCNLCTLERIENDEIEEGEILLKVNCTIESLSQLRDNMKNNTKDFIQWTTQIKQLKSKEKGLILSFSGSGWG